MSNYSVNQYKSNSTEQHQFAGITNGSVLNKAVPGKANPQEATFFYFLHSVCLKPNLLGTAAAGFQDKAVRDTGMLGPLCIHKCQQLV